MTFNEWEFYPEFAKIVQQKMVSGRQERKVILLYLNDRIQRLVDIIETEEIGTKQRQSSKKSIRTPLILLKDRSLRVPAFPVIRS